MEPQNTDFGPYVLYLWLNPEFPGNLRLDHPSRQGLGPWNPTFRVLWQAAQKLNLAESFTSQFVLPESKTFLMPVLYTTKLSMMMFVVSRGILSIDISPIKTITMFQKSTICDVIKQNESEVENFSFFGIFY